MKMKKAEHYKPNVGAVDPMAAPKYLRPGKPTSGKGGMKPIVGNVDKKK